MGPALLGRPHSYALIASPEPVPGTTPPARIRSYAALLHCSAWLEVDTALVRPGCGARGQRRGQV